MRVFSFFQALDSHFTWVYFSRHVNDATETATNAMDILGEISSSVEDDGSAYSKWILREYRSQPRHLSSTLMQVERVGRITNLPAGKDLDYFAKARIGWEKFSKKADVDLLLHEDCYTALRRYPKYLTEQELTHLFSLVVRKLDPSDELFESIFTALLLADSDYISEELVRGTISNLTSLSLRNESKIQPILTLINTCVRGFMDNRQLFTGEIILQGISTIFYHLVKTKNEQLIIIALYTLLGNSRIRSPLATDLLIKILNSLFRLF